MRACHSSPLSSAHAARKWTQQQLTRAWPCAVWPFCGRRFLAQMKNMRACKFLLTCMHTKAPASKRSGHAQNCSQGQQCSTPGISVMHAPCRATCREGFVPKVSWGVDTVPRHTPPSLAPLSLLSSLTLQTGRGYWRQLLESVSLSGVLVGGEVSLHCQGAHTHRQECRGLPRSLSTSASRTRPLMAARWA